ncbi:MAG: domain S-box [Ferruginibacter sp.]|uniref:PAS domain S-box protein n=1 Tax=Ferruginibacter sp. TaxID=1940288 RepID=UPI002657D8B7|nr:PAS domain S-box protein [Ferruginibacter sp.]MDB5276197.1 domain S-box [Ferruginibacter sp.]
MESPAAFSANQALSFFDGITSLAAFVCPDCVTYITLLNNGNTAIVSHQGNIPPALFEDDIFSTFCIESNTACNLSDTRCEARFSDSPLVAQAVVVAYTAIPLNDKEGNVLGALSVIASRVIQLSNQQILLLETLAHQAELEIINREKIKTLEERIAGVLKTNELLEQTSQVARIGAWQLDLVNQSLYWSATTRQIHGVPDSYIPDLQTAVDFYKEGQSRDTISRCVHEAILHNASYDEELQVVQQEGTVRWVRAKGDPVFEDGKCVRIFGTFQDIQLQKEQQELLEGSERKYRSIIENSLTAAFLTDPSTGTILDCNEAAAGIFGYSPEVLKTLERRDLIDVDDPKFALLAQQRNEYGRIQGELTGIRKNGERFPLLYSSALFRDREGQMRASMSAIDISSIKKVENELRLRKDEFESAFEFASIGMALVGLQGRWLRVNKSLCNMLGYTQDELLAMTFQQITHPEDLKADLGLVNQLITGEIENYKLEKRYYTKTGAIIWINLSVSLVKGSEGLPQHLISQIENISERKAAEHSLVEEKETLANVIEGTNAAVWEWNIQTGETIYNERWAGMLGYTLEELQPVNKYTWIKLTHPVDRAISNQLIKACFNRETEHYDCEYRMKHKNGQWIWVLDRGKVISFTAEGKPLKMFGIHIDITARKNIFEALQEKQAFIETVLNTINVGIVACDANGVKILLNKATRELCGLPDDYTAFNNMADFYQLYQPDGVTMLTEEEAPLHRTLVEGEINNVEIAIIPKNGIARILSANGHQIIDANGVVSGAVMALHDITERKKAEQLLAFSERRFKGIFNSTFSFIGFLAPDGTLLEANETILRFSGVKPEMVINRKLWDCYWGETSAEEKEKLKGKIARAAQGEFLEYELKIVSGNGKPIHILFNLKPLFDDDGKVIAIVSEGRPIQDIVDARKALLEKNSELEQFAFIASHDLQEPLRMIRSFMLLLRDNYAGQLDAKAKKYIDYAIDGSERMTEMVKQLLTYARIGSNETIREAIDTNELLKGILALQNAVLEEKEAQVTVHPLPGIYGMRTPLVLLFQNLISNAVKYQHPGIKPLITISARETSRNYEFAIQDNGIGIPQNHQAEIFQLFKRLHTKQEYAGTGMGLATCKKIVEQHSGKMWVQSEEGKGSVFYFTIKK